eukprot:g5178.t1
MERFWRRPSFAASTSVPKPWAASRSEARPRGRLVCMWTCGCLRRPREFELRTARPRAPRGRSRAPGTERAGEEIAGGSQRREEGMAGPGNDVCVQTAEFVLKHLPVGCRRLVDLGCGDATLAAELQSRGASVKVTNVDAARLAPGVVVQNLGALPGDWSGRFEAAVLCRALWSLDPLKVLKEAHRVLEPSPRSRLVVVEPFRRWWRPKDHEDTCQQPQNQLINALERAGFYIFKDQSVNIEGDPEGLPGKSFMKGVFQYVLASPKRDTRDATS